MAYYYINIKRGSEPKLTRWVVTETNLDRTELVNQQTAEAIEMNVPSWSFIGKFHYITCEGILTWDGTKAIINPE